MGWLGEALIMVIVLLIVAPIVGLYVRRRWLSNRGGVFDCALRVKLDQPAWMLGMARYEGNTLEWYRIFSVSLRPKLVVRRGSLELLDRRLPDEMEALALYASSEIVRMRVLGAEPYSVELAMTTDSVVGMMSWVEAGPRNGLRYPGGE